MVPMVLLDRKDRQGMTVLMALLDHKDPLEMMVPTVLMALLDHKDR